MGHVARSSAKRRVGGKHHGPKLLVATRRPTQLNCSRSPSRLYCWRPELVSLTGRGRGDGESSGTRRMASDTDHCSYFGFALHLGRLCIFRSWPDQPSAPAEDRPCSNHRDLPVARTRASQPIAAWASGFVSCFHIVVVACCARRRRSFRGRHMARMGHLLSSVLVPPLAAIASVCFRPKADVGSDRLIRPLAGAATSRLAQPRGCSRSRPGSSSRRPA